jgi:endonuclease I
MIRETASIAIFHLEKSKKAEETLRDGTKKGECANNPGKKCFEVRDNMKGDVAACYLYAFDAYYGYYDCYGEDFADDYERDLCYLYGPNTELAVEMMQALKNDPPTAQDMKQNDLIQKFQGVRNPVIDCPECYICLVDKNCEDLIKFNQAEEL